MDVDSTEATTLPAAVIFKDTTGATGGLDCSIPVANASYYPLNASGSHDAYADYKIDGYDIIACTNIQALALQYTGSIIAVDAWAPGPVRAPLRLTSSGGGVITELRLSATPW